MNKKIQETAIKFIKTLNGKIDFESVEKYANNIGYKIIFFNTPDGDIEVIRYNKENDVLHKDAFTHCGTAQIIFLNADISAENKLYLLLHEVGHIVLGHIGDGRLFLRDKTLIEIEANTFAYTVLNPPKSKTPMYVGLSALCISLAVQSVYVHNIRETINDNVIYAQDTQILPTSSSAATSDKVVDDVVNEAIGEVLVTPSGAKYHLPDCRYVKSKDCTTLTIAEAQKKYAPCLVCEPTKTPYGQN